MAIGADNKLMPTFQENWFDDDAINALREYADHTRNLPGTVMEVGCWEGKSTVALANAVNPCIVHAVDHWLGCTGDEKHITDQELYVHKRDIYGNFLRNIAEGTAGNVKVHKQDWREVFATWDEPIKILHIDASHTMEEVRDNILAALPFLVHDGVICGHDYGHPPVYAGITAALPRHAYNGLWYYVHDKPSPPVQPEPQVFYSTGFLPGKRL